MRASIVMLALFVVACGDPDPVRPPDVPAPRITLVEAPEPVLAGTVLRVAGVALDAVGRDPVLEVATGGTTFDLPSVPHDEDDAFLFEVPRTLVDALGEGFVDVTLTVEGADDRSEPFEDTWELARDLPLSLDAPPSGDVHRNDVVVLRGAGFVSATEGESFAHFEGTFTRELGGATSAVDARLPIALAERTARDRAIVVLTTDLGGVWPGTFEGTMRLESTLAGGRARDTAPVATTLRFGGPELFSVEPRMASLGALLRVRGAGFLGGRDRPSETSLIRLEGTFTPQGGTARALDPIELVPRFVSGAEVRLVIETEVREDAVVAALFGAARGEFAGTATPIVIAGTDEIEGAAVPFSFVLGPIRQIVHLRFLPGFYSSLERFGLGAAAGAIEEAIVARIEEIYASWSLEVRLEEPDDFDPTAFAVVEIGGPDPNGNGLFGYDNSPGKDIGNLRLFDRIGGANAETQMDGYPGYGGVFVESLLWWSSHPDLPGERPPSSPDPEPLFDELFDAVRRAPATLAEVRGEGDATRVAAVQRALSALASIIGETTAHELGHSLGMAQPYGAATAFHNETDGDGCLMDRGGDRPLGERARQSGFARSTFCGDELTYLDEILAR
ncbi:Hypothetical protein I5071_42770 [Sandaracinus amylolyticus]|nr:Hypothetical protein I5071_42770 [Sandaracinus amylolyticus]